MARDLALADKLRSDPVLRPRVVEVAGWRTRGADTFSPRGFVFHHTAGPRTGATPSLSTCINGRPDLPGPLCNVFLGRDGSVHVVASGRANHAGAGSWHTLSGNASVYGLEIENVGTPSEPWSPLILDLAARIAAATGVAAEFCCQHKEWAPDRKIDMHTVTGREMRERIAAIRNTPAPAPTPAPLPQEDEDMYIRDQKSGAIFAVSATHYSHLTGPQWADRQKEGAKATDMPPELVFHFCKSRVRV